MSDQSLRRASVTLSGAGIGIAGYLTYVHYAGLHPVCGISHGCETVQTSSYAYLTGLPVALLGLITYVLILATLRTRGENAFLAGYILTLIGFGFSLYLTYREVFTIHAILLVVCVQRNRVHTARGTRHAASSPARPHLPQGRGSGLGLDTQPARVKACGSRKPARHLVLTAASQPICLP
jgi:uncharacterized membrane protein